MASPRSPKSPTSPSDKLPEWVLTVLRTKQGSTAGSTRDEQVAYSRALRMKEKAEKEAAESAIWNPVSPSSP